MAHILQKDIESIAVYNLPWQEMRNCTILITGATGLIGSLLVKVLHSVNQKYQLGLRLYAIVRDSEAAEVMLHECDVEFIEQDVREPIVFYGDLHYILHCAAVTTSKLMVTFPVETIQISIHGTENILKLAKEKQVKSVVYLSSMEVYGITDHGLAKVNESELGYLDLKNPRSCYAESKRLCECMCNCYFAEYNVPIKIARLAQTFGAGVNKDDNRVFSQFAKSVISGQNIVLHTDGSSTGNYCYTADAIKGIMLLLLKGENGEAYNISNEETYMTIREMADIVARKVADGRISVVTDIPESSLKYGYASPVKMKLSSEKIRKLGWTPTIGLEEMYKKMIEELTYDQ
ncbi:NAD-dependent epimerase/dehydratase family protein [Brevibacillus centrosporus]|uniref:NAD-dependent epimerase/dehydratase family protein n=1 Tax=Brevibacillus centrosporus TaxID=54910 RepID=UPI002E22D2CE|nr:NAD-dependent epimerase/dehydratase family protein [Brevibacillus centrosporus]MED1952361.1 NAD-dependent epimerase/dehydratase family protein [Brevibacillus centrosporus]